MATIKEDYVSFETAKLLKEKGFDGVCRAGYTSYGSLYVLEVKEYLTNKICSDSYWNCTAPTLQMTMKWLRETHNIFIEISVSIDLNGEYHYSYSILNKECKYVRKGYTCFDWNYEEAAEEAIRYCLENLI